MAENTNENPKRKLTLEATIASPIDEVASAKILVQEGLIEEAKKVLYQVLFHSPGYKNARSLLDQIRAQEEKVLLQISPQRASTQTIKSENQNDLINQLGNELGIDLSAIDSIAMVENFIPSEGLEAKEFYDLGVAYFQMECFSDAIRELKKAERKIRQEQTFLGELGVSVLALQAEALIKIGKSYEAKASLEPVLSEPEIKHEEKIILFYVMGLIEEDLGNRVEAKAWLQKVVNAEPHFRDASNRLKQFS